MTDPPKLHLREQEAFALLGPIQAALDELERRTQHYLARVAMTPADAEAVRDASRVLAAARAEVGKLRQQSRHLGSVVEEAIR